MSFAQLRKHAAWAIPTAIFIGVVICVGWLFHSTVLKPAWERKGAEEAFKASLTRTNLIHIAKTREMIKEARTGPVIIKKDGSAPWFVETDTRMRKAIRQCEHNRSPLAIFLWRKDRELLSGVQIFSPADRGYTEAAAKCVKEMAGVNQL